MLWIAIAIAISRPSVYPSPNAAPTRPLGRGMDGHNADDQERLPRSRLSANPSSDTVLFEIARGHEYEAGSRA